VSAESNESQSLEAWVAEYLAAGWKLCGIEGGSKRPLYRGWQKVPLDADKLSIYPGFGLLHGFSGTACLDVDNRELATKWLAERGIDLDGLIDSPYAVRFESGRPGRTKLLYRLATPLLTIQRNANGFEFRCAYRSGGSAQDVLPPSIHPDTRKKYRWVYGEPLLVDWRNPPTIPPMLLAAWRAEGGVPIQMGTGGLLPAQALARLKEGFATTFGNGQTWTLQNGQPRQVQ
jgi:putative DNA primase/helicase